MRSHLARVQRERKRRHWRRQKPRVRWMMDMGPRLGREGPDQSTPGEEVAGERRGDQASKATSDEEDGGDPGGEFHS